LRIDKASSGRGDSPLFQTESDCLVFVQRRPVGHSEPIAIGYSELIAINRSELIKISHSELMKLIRSEPMTINRSELDPDF
jgi:hypothetical protein